MNYSLLLLLSVLFLVGFQNDAPAPHLQNPIHEKVRPQLDSATALFMTGDLAAAQAVFQQIIRDVENRLPANDSMMGEVYQWMGNVWYNRENADYQQALQWYQKSIAVREQPGGGRPEELVRACRAAALSCNQLLHFTAAKQYFEKAAAVVREKNIQQPLYLANLKNGLGEYYLLTGDPERAADYYEDALLLYKKCPPGDPQAQRNLPVCLQNLGIACDRMGRPEKAAGLYQQAIPAFQNIQNTTGESQSLHNLGMAMHQTGQISGAMAQFRRALLLNQTNLDTLEMARNFAEIARVHLTSHQWSQAINTAGQSLGLRLSVCRPGDADITEAYCITGDIYVQQGQMDQAYGYYREAIHNASQRPNDLEKLKALAAAINCLEKMPGQQQAMHQHCLDLDQCYLDVRKRFEFDDIRFKSAEMIAGLYEKAIANSFRQYQQTGAVADLNAALRFAEHSKSLALVEDISKQSGHSTAGVPKDVQEKEKELRAVIFSKKAAVQAAKEEVSYQKSKSELANAVSEYDYFIDRLKSTCPGYYQLKYEVPAPLTAEKIRSGLSGGQLLVEYFEGQKTIFVMAFSKEYNHIFQIERTDSLLQDLATFREGTSGEQTAPGPAFTGAAYRLYQQLLAPAIQHPAQTTPVNVLRIVPDGELNYLSFEALLTEPASDAAADKAPYLLKKVAVSYLPSSILLEKPGVTSTDPSIAFGGFGIEYKEGPQHYRLSPDTSAAPSAVALRDKLGVLEYADDEVQSGKSLLGGKVWLNGQVTVENFKQKSPECDVLHLAVHGAVDENSPLNSALVFAPHPDSATGQSHLLRAADIYGMSIPARLAILSACNTGSGVLRRGEGVQSLSRAFTVAGCQSQVVTLWSIPDQSTSEIIRLFLEQLKAGLPKDEALRAAKLAFIQQARTTQHLQPNFWAATAVFGDVEPLYPAGYSWNWWLMGALTGLFFVGLVVWYTQRKVVL